MMKAKTYTVEANKSEKNGHIGREISPAGAEEYTSLPTSERCVFRSRSVNALWRWRRLRDVIEVG